MSVLFILCKILKSPTLIYEGFDTTGTVILSNSILSKYAWLEDEQPYRTGHSSLRSASVTEYRTRVSEYVERIDSVLGSYSGQPGYTSDGEEG